jgi:CRISPR-associated endonuclease/helicase Cas3
MEIISHPNPDYALKEHLINTKNRALSKYKPPRLKYFDVNVVEDILKIICLSHDFGKSTTYFQKYIRKEKIEKNILKRHSEISFILANYIIKNYLEKENIKDKYCEYYRVFSLCVKNHHTNLSEFIHNVNRSDDNILRKQFESLNFDFINNILKENNFPTIDPLKLKWEQETEELEYICGDLPYESDEELKIEIYYLYQYLFSLLIASDKEDAIFRGGEIEKINNINVNKEIPSNINNYIQNLSYNKKPIPINNLRTEIFNKISKKAETINLNQKIYSLNAPTGIGKTLTVFNFALKLANRINAEKNKDMKIIYCLPFLSIIDQNYKVLSDVLENPPSNVLLKHHYLSEVSYRHGGNGENEEENIFDENKSLHLIETWSSKIITTTFIQLFYSIFSNKNSNLKKFNSLSNSIIILDEIQSIPHKYWYLVNKIFKFLANECNIYFILTTATLPMIFEENEYVELLDDRKYYFSKLNRIKMKIHKNNIGIDEFIELIDNDITNNPDKDFLIVLNTIKSSKEVYNLLKEKNYNDTEYYYLSTNIYPKERLNRIKKIKGSSQRKIIVSTQLIEAGVDISVDIVYRDIAPMDSINQTAGRCNRHGEGINKGIVNVIKLIDDRNRLYAKYIYKGILLSKTMDELLSNYEIIEEKEFLELNNKYFNKLKGYNDESKEFLETIGKFKYDKMKEFILIDDLPTIPIFVAFDENSKKIWNKYLEIKEMKPSLGNSKSQGQVSKFEKKNEFLKIKKDFYDYVITIPKHAVKGKDIWIDENNINYVDSEKYYNIETGFEVVEDKTIVM